VRPLNGGTKYLRKFTEKAVSVGEQLENLAMFARADSSRARTIQQTLDEIRLVMADVVEYRAKAEQQKLEKEEAAIKLQENIVKYHDEIAALVDAVVPGLSSELPDIKAVNKGLGTAREYRVLKQLQAILTR